MENKLFLVFPVSMKKSVITAQVNNATMKANGYSLMSDIEYVDKTFSDIAEAKAYLLKEDYGVMCNMAVKVKGVHMKSENHKSLELKVEDLKKKLEEIEKPHALKSAAKLISCRNEECSSKIAKKFITSNYCPVCGADMRPDTLVNKRNRIEKALTDAIEKLKVHEERWAKKLSKPAEDMYFIKAES